MNQRKVIDMWAPVLPTHEVMTHVADNYPEAQLGYLRVFSKREPNLEDYRSYALRLAREDRELIVDLDAAGIMKAVITGFDERTTAGRTFVGNECVAALVERHPDRFIAFAGVDIMRGHEAIRQLEYWVTQ